MTTCTPNEKAKLSLFACNGIDSPLVACLRVHELNEQFSHGGDPKSDYRERTGTESRASVSVS